MGMEYSARLLVGLSVEDFPDDFFTDDVGGDCDEKGLIYASPYYDAPVRHWVVGYKVAKSDDYGWNYVDIDQHNIAHVKFTEITGLNGKLILSTHGY